MGGVYFEYALQKSKQHNRNTIKGFLVGDDVGSVDDYQFSGSLDPCGPTEMAVFEKNHGTTGNMMIHFLSIGVVLGLSAGFSRGRYLCWSFLKLSTMVPGLV